MSHHIHNILLFQIWFRGGRARFSGFAVCPFPCNVVACNPLFIPGYHPVKKGLDFVPSKQRCAYDNSIVQIFPTWFTWHPSWILPHQSYLPNMVRNGSLSWIKPFRDLRCRRKRILLQHCLNNIVVDQRWSWLIRKVEITRFKFFVPSCACPIRNCTFTKHFQ